MLDVLRPLVPLAKALDVPLLDFDRYADSRDSARTAAVVVPVVADWLAYHLKQEE
jgi:hypothetical protein